MFRFIVGDNPLRLGRFRAARRLVFVAFPQRSGQNVGISGGQERKRPVVDGEIEDDPVYVSHRGWFHGGPSSPRRAMRCHSRSIGPVGQEAECYDVGMPNIEATITELDRLFSDAWHRRAAAHRGLDPGLGEAFGFVSGSARRPAGGLPPLAS